MHKVDRNDLNQVALDDGSCYSSGANFDGQLGVPNRQETRGNKAELLKMRARIDSE